MYLLYSTYPFELTFNELLWLREGNVSLLHHLVFHIYLSLFPCSHLNLCIQKIRQRICLTVIHKPTVWIKELNSVLSFIFSFHCFIYIFICLLAPASFQKHSYYVFPSSPAQRNRTVFILEVVKKFLGKSRVPLL